MTTERIKIISGFPLPAEDIPINQSGKTGDTKELEFEHFIPSFVPHGTYGVEALSLGPNGEQLECLHLSVTI